MGVILIAACYDWLMIHYQISGTGDNWLVFVHGLSCDSTDWSSQVKAFQYDYQCLTVDLRGHGRSRAHSGPLDIETHASDVNQVLRSLNISNALLVGHSMGTRVIASAALQAPGCVAGLVFVDGSIQGRGQPMQAAEDIVSAINKEQSVAIFAGKMFSMMFTSQSDSALQERIIDRATQMDPDRLVEQLRVMMMWDAGRSDAVLSQLKVPLTLLQSTIVGADKKRTALGVGDRSQYLEAVQQLVPHAMARMILDCGHFTQIEAADETNKVLRDCATEVFR